MKRFPILGKTLAVGVVLLALTIALDSVRGVVNERQGRLHEAEQSVADSLASQQLLLGPVLQRQCVESWISEQGEGKERKLVQEQRSFTLTSVPASLEISTQASIEPRYRGIFKVNGYALKAKLQAQWADTAALEPTASQARSTLRCGATSLFVAVGDARGIRNATMTLGGSRLAVLPGTAHTAHPRGFHAVLPESDAAPAAARGPLQAEVTLELVGTGDLAFAPVAHTTRVDLASNWPHPSFSGRFLPSQRSVGPDGFKAHWELSALATTAPQALLDGAAACGFAPAAPGSSPCIETFGVSFVDPVSSYVLSDRATKYGLLFIALTFVGVGLVEVLRRLRVHPVQYLLVGSALAIFFLLLVSLTEHIAFAWAYLCASAACTALLTFYASHVLRGLRAGMGFGAAIAALYGALFMLLQLEQSALVLGSLLLFAVLASVMVATRKVDWYALMAQLRSEASAPARAPQPSQQDLAETEDWA